MPIRIPAFYDNTLDTVIPGQPGDTVDPSFLPAGGAAATLEYIQGPALLEITLLGETTLISYTATRSGIALVAGGFYTLSDNDLGISGSINGDYLTYNDTINEAPQTETLVKYSQLPRFDAMLSPRLHTLTTGDTLIFSYLASAYHAPYPIFRNLHLRVLYL